MKRYIPFILLLQSCIGAGDMFAERKHIIGPYFLIEGESGDYRISRKVDDAGTTSSRTPSSSNVIGYAVRDSLLVMKTINRDSSQVYYVLNMNKDGEFKNMEDCIIDTIEASAINASIYNSQKYKYIKVKPHNTHIF